MENQFRPEDEINYKNLLKDPVRLFAIVYPYILILFVVAGVYWAVNMDYAYKNTHPKVKLARDTVAPEIPVQHGSIMEGVDVKVISISTPELVKKGEELYKANCASCHGNEGKGDGIAGAALNPKPRNFGELDGWKNGASISGMWKTLEEGIVGGGMVAYNYLPVEDRFALIHFMHSLMSEFPKDSDSDLEMLDQTYSLSKGKVTPNTISVSMAINKLSAEYSTHSERIIKLSEMIKGAEDENLRNIFIKIISNCDKVAATLVNGKNWHTNPDTFIKEIGATINNNGFKLTALRLTKDELITVYNFFVNAHNLISIESQNEKNSFNSLVYD